MLYCGDPAIKTGRGLLPSLVSVALMNPVGEWLRTKAPPDGSRVDASNDSVHSCQQWRKLS